MAPLTRRHFTLAAVGAAAGALTLSSSASAVGHHAAPDPGAAASPPKPRQEGEVRGVWIATVQRVDWPSGAGLAPEDAQEELLAYLDDAVRWNLNTVYFQVRPSADALWPSPHEPWSEFLTGTQGEDPGWDPLGFAVEEAHRRGLELHAWFNPYRVAMHDDPQRLTEDHPARQNPDWVVTYGGQLYYNPGIPEVRRFTQDAMLHAAENYAIDGVHWDDYFYPYPVDGASFDDDAAWQEHGGDFADRGDWRRDNVDLLVQEMSERVKEIRSDLTFSVSPFGIWRNAGTDPNGSDTTGLQSYDELYADTRRWVTENWVDCVIPQLYWHIGFAAADYATLVAWWAETVRGTGTELVIGEAMYRVGAPGEADEWQNAAEVSDHLTLAADHPEATGHVFFSATSVVNDPLGAMTRVYEDHYA